jgi:hypothetical protein
MDLPAFTQVIEKLLAGDGDPADVREDARVLFNQGRIYQPIGFESTAIDIHVLRLCYYSCACVAPGSSHASPLPLPLP